MPALVVADAGALVVAAALAGILSDPAVSTRTAAPLLIALPVWLLLAKAYRLYERDVKRAYHSTADELPAIAQAVTIGAWVVFLLAATTTWIQVDLASAISFWLLGALTLPTARATARAIARRRPGYLHRTVIVGAGDVGQTMARKILQHPEYGLLLLGFVDSMPRRLGHGLEPVPVLGDTSELEQFAEEHAVDRVIFAFSTDSHDYLLGLIRHLRTRDVHVDIVPRLFEALPGHWEGSTIEGIPLIAVPRTVLSRASRAVKRAFDFVVSSIALFLFVPLLVAVALAIKLDSRGSVFFRQLRMGANEQTFEILKFRTMVADADRMKADLVHLNRHATHGDTRMFKIPNDPRVTRVGGMLRRYSLDELPQLINVVKGDMTLVGPRPLVLDEDEHVPAWARERLQLKPGITGIWQVLGNSFIPFDEMVKLDYLYVNSWSLWTDVSLMLKTLRVVAGNREYA